MELRQLCQSVSRAMKSLLLIALSLAMMPEGQPHRRVKRRNQPLHLKKKMFHIVLESLFDFFIVHFKRRFM